MYANDDAEATRQSTLPSLDPLTPAAPGVYLLGVSPYNRDPHGATGAIFPERRWRAGPDLGRAAGLLDRWRPAAAAPTASR